MILAVAFLGCRSDMGPSDDAQADSDDAHEDSDGSSSDSSEGGDEDIELEVHIETPRSGEIVGGAVNVTVGVTGGGDGLRLEFDVDGETISVSEAEPFEFLWDTCASKDGAHELVVRATDASGQAASASAEPIVANAEAPPELRGRAAETANRLDWKHCGDFDSYRVFWGASPGIDLGSAAIDVEYRYMIHEPEPMAARYYYRVAAVVGGEAGTLSNEVELTPETLPPRICSVDGWCWDRGPPQGHDIGALWGHGDDLFAVGDGFVLHWDGLGWQRSAVGVEPEARPWGLAPDDVWLASSSNRLLHWDGIEWREGGDDLGNVHTVWGLGHDEIWAVGTELFRFDGQQWQDVGDQTTDGFHLKSIWASAPDDVWLGGNGVFGEEGSLLHSDGSGWTISTSGHTDRTDLWGSASDDIWSVGAHGSILHWDGVEWTAFDSGTVESLEDIDGCSADDVWVVGSLSTVRHWDGQGWTNLQPPTRMDLRGVSCRPTRGVTVVGERGETLVWDGARWSVSEAERTGPLRSVADMPGGPWVTGEYETILQRGTDGWQRLAGTLAGSYPNVQLGDMHGASSDDAWAVGERGSLVHWDGGSWESHQPVVSDHLTAVWAIESDDVWAVGSDGIILHYDGISWVPVEAGRTSLFSDVWGSTSDDVWAVGWDGLAHWNGTSWDMDPTSADEGRSFDRVWGASPDDVWALGSENTVLRNTGSGWTRHDPGVDVDGFFYDIHGSAADNVWIPSENYFLRWDGASWTRTEWDFPGLAPRDVWTFGPDDTWMAAKEYTAHWNGNEWNTATPPSVREIAGLWGSDGSNVFAYGEAGTIGRWDGMQWELQAPAAIAPQHLGSTWIESPTSLWMVGDYGTIRHWDGQTWTEHDSGTLAQLFGIDGVDGNDIWAVGEAGTILHYDGQEWSAVEGGAVEDVGGVWAADSGDVYAVVGTFYYPDLVYNGSVLHRSPTGVWSFEATPNVPTLLDIWGSATDDIWAVGRTTVIHYDGAIWLEVTLPSELRSQTFLDIWGRHESEVWAVGGAGIIMHWDGSGWQYEEAPGRATLYAVGGNAEAVWAVGTEGAIFRRDNP